MTNTLERSNASGKVLAVAWREFKHTALTKAFIIGTLVFPVFIWGLMAVSQLFISREPPPLTGTIAILDPGGLVAAEATRQFEELKNRAAPSVSSTVEAVSKATQGDAAAVAKLAEGLTEDTGRVAITVIHETDPAKADELRTKVGSNELLAFASIDPKLLTIDPGDVKLELLVQTTTSPKHTSLYSRILREATVKSRVASVGEDYAKLMTMLKSPEFNTQRVTRDGGTAKERADARMLVPIAFMMLVWIATFSSGNYLLTTTIEEKSNKVMEVLLSAVSPMQLLAGKILGQALVSAVIIVIYGGAGLLGPPLPLDGGPDPADPDRLPGRLLRDGLLHDRHDHGRRRQCGQ